MSQPPVSALSPQQSCTRRLQALAAAAHLLAEAARGAGVLQELGGGQQPGAAARRQLICTFQRTPAPLTALHLAATRRMQRCRCCGLGWGANETLQLAGNKGSRACHKVLPARFRVSGSCSRCSCMVAPQPVVACLWANTHVPSRCRGILGKQWSTHPGATDCRRQTPGARPASGTRPPPPAAPACQSPAVRVYGITCSLSRAMPVSRAGPCSPLYEGEGSATRSNQDSSS